MILTICIGIKCIRGKNQIVLFASDTQESSTYLKRPTTKIRTIHSYPPKDKKKEQTLGNLNSFIW